MRRFQLLRLSTAIPSLFILLFYGCMTSPRYVKKTGPVSAPVQNHVPQKKLHQRDTTPAPVSTINPESHPEPQKVESEPPRKDSKVTYTEEGLATYYANKFHGRRTASGELYNKNAFTAAHRTLPFNSTVIVTSQENGKSVTVRINDRGPHSKGRIIDLSRVAAEKIGLIRIGVCKVTVRVLEDN